MSKLSIKVDQITDSQRTGQVQALIDGARENIAGGGTVLIEGTGVKKELINLEEFDNWVATIPH